jgi:stage V sporulation protein SpoVS
MIVFRVKSSTDIKKLGGAIFTNIKNCDEIELSCLGAGSLNQAIKSVIIAKSFAAPVGINLVVDPSFAITEVEEQEKTLIKLIVKKI